MMTRLYVSATVNEYLFCFSCEKLFCQIGMLSTSQLTFVIVKIKERHDVTE